MHEGHLAKPDRSDVATLVHSPPPAGHATTRPWDAELFTGTSKSARGICSQFRCGSNARFAWFEARFGQAEWKAFCDEHLPHTADQLAAADQLRDLTERLRAAVAAQRDRHLDAVLRAAGVPPLVRMSDFLPTCPGCGVVVFRVDDHVKFLRPPDDPVVAHVGCVTPELVDVIWSGSPERI